MEPCSTRQRLTLLTLLLISSLSFIGFYYPRKWSKHRDTRDRPNTTDTKGLMTLRTDGRLGDQMGGYAVLYALAKINRRQAYVQPMMHEKLSPLFQTTLPVFTEEQEDLPWKTYNKGDWLSERYCHIEGEYVMLVGYFCSWTFFHHIREEILREFTFYKHVKEEARRSLSRLSAYRRTPTFVGVHVRRGDYVKKMAKSYRGVVADRPFLENAIGYFRARYGEPVFVVVSDDMQWCRQNVDTSRGDVYFAGQGIQTSPEKDFSLLAHCNHTIITIGTFGFWAAYLAGGEVVYLANYTLPNSPWLRSSSPSAFYLPYWVGMPANLTPLLAATDQTGALWTPSISRWWPLWTNKLMSWIQ